MKEASLLLQFQRQHPGQELHTCSLLCNCDFKVSLNLLLDFVLVSL